MDEGFLVTCGFLLTVAHETVRRRSDTRQARNTLL
jgi:hypothetical protein